MRPFLKVVIALGAIGFIIAILVPRNVRPVVNENLRIKNNIRMAVIGITAYQQANGRYPDTLRELSEEYLPNDVVHFQDPISGYEYDWIYFGKGIEGKEIIEDFVLLATPTALSISGDDLRIVAYGDGRVEAISESEFRK